MLADIASGETGTADVAFLLALFAAAFAVVLYVVGKAWAPALVALSVGLVAFGWLVL